MKDSRYTITLLSLVLLTGCGTAPPRSEKLPAEQPVRFTDVTGGSEHPLSAQLRQ